MKKPVSVKRLIKHVSQSHKTTSKDINVTKNNIGYTPVGAGKLTVVYLANKHSRVHALLKQDGGVPHIVAGHQGVGVVHAGRVHGEPADGSYRHAVLPNQPQLHHPLIYVVFVSAIHRAHAGVLSTQTLQLRAFGFRKNNTLTFSQQQTNFRA
jgi:hypothetical protein